MIKKRFIGKNVSVRIYKRSASRSSVAKWATSIFYAVRYIWYSLSLPYSADFQGLKGSWKTTKAWYRESVCASSRTKMYIFFILLTIELEDLDIYRNIEIQREFVILEC